MSYVVTGATGHIGGCVLRCLLAQGEKVKAPIRGEAPEWMKELGADTPLADVCSAEAMRSLIEPGDTVIHCAGMISLTNSHAKEMYRINVKAASQIADICAEVGARLVYVSSVDALGNKGTGKVMVPDVPSDKGLKSQYALTKNMATRYVLSLARKAQLDGVVVYPSCVIGPYDYRPSCMGQIIKSYLKGGPMAVMKGGYNFVDVRDAARGIVLAAQKAKPGSSFFLTGECMTVQQLAVQLSQLAGRRLPPHVPLWLVRAAAPFAAVSCELLGRRPVLSPHALDALNSNYDYDAKASVRELGYTYRSAQDSMRDTVEWFRARQEK